MTFVMETHCIFFEVRALILMRHLNKSHIRFLTYNSFY